MPKEDFATIEEAIEEIDRYAKIACRAILSALEADGGLNKYNRKVVLDAINDLKRSSIRFIYKVK